MPQTIVFTYTAVVLDTVGNRAGDVLNNSAVFSVQGGSQSASTPVNIVEPHVLLGLSRSSATGDAGGAAITFTLLVSASSGTGADAYNVLLSDVVPSGYAYVTGSLTNTAGEAPSSLSDSSGVLSADFADMAPGASSTLTFEATLSSSTTPGETVVEPASLTYTSLPGTDTTPQSPYNSISTERTGDTSDPGGAANTYATSASASVTVNVNSISGVVFEDSNDDGTQQGTEPGIPGVTVVLTGHDNLGNAVNLMTTTSGHGLYSFSLLRPGTYTETMTPPSGYLDGKDSVGTPFGGSNPVPDFITSIAIPLGTNPSGTGYNFAELLPASIAGEVFSDLNDNGSVNPGESGIPGVVVTLTGTNDLGDSVNTTGSTNSSGLFDFMELRPGTYTVSATQPSGFLPGRNARGNSGGITSSGNTLSGITLDEDQADSGITYGELVPASLTGTVYLDENDDGIKQSGEPGIGNVLVTLTGTDDLGNAVNSATLTSNGAYSFTGLRPGTYSVSEATPSGLIDGKASAGSLGGNATVRDVISAIPVSSAALGTSYNLAVLQPATISGTAYIDSNDDGLKEGTESGVSGVTIILTGTDDLGNAVSETTLAASDGSYSFGNLEPGTYADPGSVPSGDFGGKATVGSLGGGATLPDSVAGLSLSPIRWRPGTTSASSSPRAFLGLFTLTPTTMEPSSPVRVVFRV